jgi:2-keto-4-pentenoate hydratase/2-oxohepta-3-ene-1,7-dioic acid hydratase in catechol pathway
MPAIPTDPSSQFIKAPCIYSGPDVMQCYLKDSVKADWEAELASRDRQDNLCGRGRCVDRIAGYFICNDISEREFQLREVVRSREDGADFRPARPVAGHASDDVPTCSSSARG